MTRLVLARIGWIACLVVSTTALDASPQTSPAPAGRGQAVLGSPGRPGATPPTEGADLTVEFVGGYEDAREPAELAPAPDQSGVVRTGYTTVTTGTLRFGHGRRADKFLRGAAAASLGYQQLGSDFEAVRTTRGDVALQAGLPIGGRAGVLGSMGVGYEPAYLFGSFAALDAPPDHQGQPTEPVESVDPVTTAGPLSGVTRQRWLASNGAVGVFRNLTTRQRMELQYTDAARQPISGAGFDSRSRFLRWRHTWNARPGSGFEFAYRIGETSQTAGGAPDRSVDLQSVDVQWRLTRRRSPTKAVSLSIGGGADYTRAPSIAGDQSFENVSPTVFGSTRLDLSTNWTATADVRRQVAVLEGLAPEAFTTSVAALRIEGAVARKVRLSLTGAYSIGTANMGGPGSFATVVAGAQLQYGLGRHLGLVADYSYYEHQLREVALAQPFLPNDYRRSSLRVGVTLWLPLHGGL